MKSVAIIGCGRAQRPDGKVGWGIAHAHAAGYRAAFADAAIHAVDINPDNLQAFARAHNLPSDRCFTSTEALYARLTPDMVSLCTWPILHAQQLAEAIRNGVRAIVCEKPIATSGLEIDQLRQTMEQGSSRVAIAHQRQYLPAFVRARELLADGVLGDNLVVEGRIDDDWDMLSWTVHWFDMANYLLDATPRSILAGIEDLGERRYGHPVERMSCVFADYADDRQAQFVTGPAALPDFGISVRGARGMLRVVGGQALQLWTRDGYHEPPAPPGKTADPFASLIADLWQAAETNGPTTRCEFEQTAIATEMVFAAQESARIRRRVALPLKARYAPLELGHHPVATGDPARQILLVADNHHFDNRIGLGGRDGVLAALRAIGHQVRWFDPTVRDPVASDFEGIDLLVLYHTHRKASAATRRWVGEWFELGKPVVVSHCGIGAWDDWPEYRRWTGLHWIWSDDQSAPGGSRPSTHPHAPCTITVTAPHFTTPWRQAWIPADEVYHDLGQAGEIELLATVNCGRGDQPGAWRVVDHPNVTGWLPGHRPDIWDLPVLREGLQAAIRLATSRDHEPSHATNS